MHEFVHIADYVVHDEELVRLRHIKCRHDLWVLMIDIGMLRIGERRLIMKTLEETNEKLEKSSDSEYLQAKVFPFICYSAFTWAEVYSILISLHYFYSYARPFCKCIDV